MRTVVTRARCRILLTVLCAVLSATAWMAGAAMTPSLAVALEAVPLLVWT